MFNELQRKWKMGPLQILLILFCFAFAGSITAFTAKKAMNILFIQKDWLWVIIYILLITLIWPLAVLFVSIFFGQFRFFSGYLHRMGIKIGLMKNSTAGQAKPGKVNIAIFASGKGSNAQKIINHFREKDSDLARIALIVCNKKNAGVLEIAQQENIPTLIIQKERFFSGDAYLQELRLKKIDLIVLAGFLWKIPEILIKEYPGRIVNIHPALLPKFGGRGMYGNHVHEAVLGAKEQESGITIHFVDEHYDNGDIILQVKCPVLPGDTPESLANRIHLLEHANYPVIIEELVRRIKGLG